MHALSKYTLLCDETQPCPAVRDCPTSTVRMMGSTKPVGCEGQTSRTHCPGPYKSSNILEENYHQNKNNPYKVQKGSLWPAYWEGVRQRQAERLAERLCAFSEKLRPTMPTTPPTDRRPTTPPTDRQPTPTDRLPTPPTDPRVMSGGMPTSRSGGMPPDPRKSSGGMPTSCSGGMPPDPRMSSGGKPTSLTTPTGG